MRTPLAIRFERQYEPVTESGCWIWTGACHPVSGHGAIGSGGNKENKPLRAHRVSWELYRGPIPDGLVVCHKCDTPACVNPDHLFVGTQADNVRDMIAKGRDRKARGKERPDARLNDDAIRAIRSDARSNPRIARDYGVSTAHIWNIKHRRKWAHVA